MTTDPKAIDLQSCTLNGVTSRADHSVRLSILTAELRPSEAGVLVGMHGQAVRVMIVPHDDADAPMVEVTTERGDKTPSQRLRAVLFVAYQAKPVGDFDTYYRRRMECFINSVKEELEP